MENFTLKISRSCSGDCLKAIRSLKKYLSTSLLFILLMCGAAINAQVNIRGVAPVQTPPEGFAVDGDAYAGQPVSPVDFSAYGDWFIYNDAPGGIFPEDINVNSIDEDGQIPGGWPYDHTFFFRDDITNNDPTIFTSSNKINDHPATYTWGAGSSPNKNEIQNAMVHFSFGNPLITDLDGTPGDPNDLWILFAADREVTNGSSYIDFELLQETLIRTGTTSGGFTTGGLDGGRTVGDILITLEFTVGGGAANVVVRRWEQTSDGYAYVVLIADPTGEKVLYSSNNSQAIEVPYPLYNQSALPNGNYQYAVNQWAEGAANLSKLFNSDPCFSISTLFVRTRTSGSSGQSELKDFPGGPVQLELNLNPVADLTTSGVCDGNTATFTATPTGSGEQYTFFIDTDEDGEIDPGETILQAKSGVNIYEDDGLNDGDVITVLIETALGCKDFASEAAIIYENPTADAGTDDSACFDGETYSINLNGSASGGTGPYDFSWSPATFLDDASAEDPVFSGAPASETPYTLTLTVTDANGCSHTDTVDITINENPTADAGADDSACFDGDTYSINLDGSASGGTGPYDFSWSPATFLDDASAEDPVFSGAPASETPYTLTLTVTDANGCSDTDTVDITIYENPTISIEQPQLDCFADSASMIVTSPQDKTGWEFRLVIKGEEGTFSSYPDGGYPGLAPETTYVLTAKDPNGCTVDEEFTTPTLLDTPITPTLDAIQPDCDTFQGTIIVTNHIEGQTYSVKLKSDISDPVFVAYPANGFENLDPGTYVVIARSADLCSSGGAEITLLEPECVFDEGCTLGYWKNHTDRWCDEYLTCDLYGDVFEAAPSKLADLTLLEALNLEGGGIYNLARQSVAALLNTCSSEVGFAYSNVEALIADVNDAFTNDEAGAFGMYLDGLNQAGCPLDGTFATTAPSDECPAEAAASLVAAAGFSVSPVPFVDQLSVQYHFDYVSDVNIQFFNFSGQLLQNFKFLGVTSGDISEFNVGSLVSSGQTYIIKVNTDRESFSKTIISSE
ncbi:PKD domain-containing protein [Gramella jeungdoensis]|uniref:PKD domain-containing protein n=1 Tax=Gramella jeungdoensis TaxID=708091 RepID=A0ABT0Z5Y1_9FLAO|nr:PKD domain-containing protein [Gramella jeungdoensis]MCM8571136.1 PKD domain-containing protein [Gramella jeungdoensis]